jgi:hypothetical protein
MKAAPKQAEKVAVGSFTPSTVPATCITKTIHSRIHCRGIEETIKRTNWLFISSGISNPQIAYQGSVTTDEVIHRLCMRQFADWWQDTKCITCEQDNILWVWSHARQLDVRDELYRISCPCVLCRTRQKQSITNQQVSYITRHLYNNSGYRKHSIYDQLARFWQNLPVTDLSV